LNEAAEFITIDTSIFVQVSITESNINNIESTSKATTNTSVRV
jgi:hypothetical protein